MELGLEPGTLHMSLKHSTAEQHPDSGDGPGLAPLHLAAHVLSGTLLRVSEVCPKACEVFLANY